MARREANRIVHYIRKLVPEPDLIGHGDGSLLERFVRLRDALAFAEILRRHGPMVWGVCRRLLDCPHAAEDAFQATFLVLLKKSGHIARRDKLANWLYGVACRTAARARVDAARRRRHERSTPGRPMVKPADEVMWRDLRPVLDEEVQRLPERYRTPFVLCYLEGLTNRQAADQLGCPEGTVVSRLAWARQRLRARLSRRGVALSVSLLAVPFSETESVAAVPMALADAAARIATLSLSGQAGVVAITPSAVILMEGVLHSMLFARIKFYAIAFLMLAVLGSAAGVFSYRSLAAERQAGNAEQAAAPADAPAANDLPAADPVRMQLTRMQLEAAQKELVQVQSDLRKAQVELTLARSKEKEQLAEALSAVEQNLTTQALQQNVKRLEKQIERATAAYIKGPDEPAVLSLRGSLAVARQELEERIKVHREGARKAVKRQSEKHVERVEYLKELEKVLVAAVIRLGEEAGSQAQPVEQRLGALEREVRQLRRTIDGLKDKK